MSNTFRQKMEDMLCSTNMPKDQAAAIMSMAEQQPNLKPLEGKWDWGIEKFDSFSAFVASLAVMNVAREWIKENAPQAPFRRSLEDMYTERMSSLVDFRVEVQAEKLKAVDNPLEQTHRRQPRHELGYEPQ